MSEWKKVKIDFDTIKLKDFIEPIKTTVLELGEKNPIVYGVTNKEGIVQTGKPASKDISNYIVLEDDCFAFNPYRVNVGFIGINDKKLKGCVSPAYIVFKTKNGLLPKFLYFYLKSDYGIHLINWYGNRGGVRNALRYSDLCNIDIPNINHLDQQKILRKFLSASAKIDEICKEIESQKNYAKLLRQNILQEAIEGKLTEDWRKKNPVQKGSPDYDAEALFEQIQNERNNEKKQKELSPITDEDLPAGKAGNPFEIPKGWKWVRLEFLSSNILYGVSESAKENGKYKLLRITDIQNNFVDWDTVPYTDFNEAKVNQYLLHKDDILFARTGGTVGKSYLVEDCPSNTIYASYLIRVRLTKSINSHFIKSFFESPFYWKQITDNLSGTGQPNCNGQKLSNLVLPLPPLKEQEEIVNKVETLLAKVTPLEKQIQDRKSLSDKLIFGIIKENLEEK